MQSEISSRRVRMVTLLFVAAFSPGFFLYFAPQNSDLPKVVRNQSGAALLVDTPLLLPLYEENRFSFPVRLKIPNINIDAGVEFFRLGIDGTMGMPENADKVGWFTGGQHPGEIGTAVFAGHFGWKNGIPAVFDNLYQLRRGDKLFVEDATGITTAFVVREIRVYGEHDNASDVFISNDGKAHLNLVTCQGVWNRSKKSYSERLIVFTDKETEI